MNQINQITSGLKEKNLIGEMRSALAYLNKTEKKSPKIFWQTQRQLPKKALQFSQRVQVLVSQVLIGFASALMPLDFQILN